MQFTAFITRSTALLCFAIASAGLGSRAHGATIAAAPVADVKITKLPFRIVRCGYYFLDECLEGKAGQDGITILASDVTLDLQGYSVLGVPGSFSAVRVGAAVSGVRVQNGGIRGWGDHGVHADLGTSCTFENLHLIDINKNAIRGGAQAHIRGCTAESSGDAAITAASGIIESCRASAGGNDGFFLGQGTISGCTAKDNDFHGIITGGACTIERCTVSESGKDGIDAGAGSTVVHCTVESSLDHGIKAGAGSTVQSSTARTNGLSGLDLADGSTASGCTADGNGDHGIQVATSCQVRANSCSNNASAGIRVLVGASSSRIDENQVAANATGIQIDGSRNLIVRNTASANTASYTIAAGNAFGQIVNVSGTGSFASTDPWQNLIF